MKISKQESNFEIEISAEEITSLSGLLKNDNAMELVSGILRYFQIQTERARLEESLNIEKAVDDYVKREELTKIKDKSFGGNNPDSEEEAETDPEYFVGIPNTSDEGFIRKMQNKKELSMANRANNSEEDDLTYFIGVPSNGSHKI